MHIVSSITILAIIPVWNKATVLKNNQNSGDLSTSSSFICVSEAMPGINIHENDNRLMIIIIKINANFRHLYLSVKPPTIGRINKPGSGISVKVKPTMTDE